MSPPAPRRCGRLAGSGRRGILRPSAAWKTWSISGVVRSFSSVMLGSALSASTNSALPSSAPIEPGDEHDAEVAMQARAHLRRCTRSSPHSAMRLAQLLLGLGEVRRQVVAVDGVVGQLVGRGVLGCCNCRRVKTRHAANDQDERQPASKTTIHGNSPLGSRAARAMNRSRRGS